MQLENVEDFYPLAPAQQGMLFHTVHDRTSTYFGNLAFTFFEEFDDRAFENAWRCLVERHAVLRTFFVWDGLKEPVQVVRRDIPLPLERQDWRTLSAEEQARQVELFVKADRAKGLDLGKAPVMRLTLIRLDEERYRFFWSHHHILFDGWSVSLLLDEFLTLYAAGDAEPALPQRRPYRDYIAWLAKQNSADAEAYWRNLFRGFDSRFALGDFLPRGAPSRITTREQEQRLDPALFDSLREAARRQRVTLNTLVQAAWTIVLQRFSGLGDLVYGVTLSGRPPELDGSDAMVGLFINTLPMRVLIHDAMPLSQLFQAIQTQQTETRQFEYSRLVDVQIWSGATRGAALFDSIFVFENYPISTNSSNGAAPVKAGELAFDQSTNYPVTLAVTLGETLTLRCLHDPARVTSHGAAVLLRCLHLALESIAANTAQVVGMVQIVARDEDARLDARRPLPTETIPQLFAAQAIASPARLAVVGDSDSLTYRELDDRSNALAFHLRTLGAEPGQIVALCLDRDPSFATSILAVLKAGAAYLPLDPALPQSRIDYMLRDSGARLGITTAAHSSKVSALTSVRVDLDSAAITASPLTPLDVELSPASLAYVIYTSGSTGNPKGVMVSHSSLANLVYSQTRAFEITSESRVLQFASASFDASVSEIFCALLSGAALHFPGSSAQRGGYELLQSIEEREISVLTLPPSLLAVLPYRDLPRLCTLIAAGEPCPPSVVSRWSAGRRFLNAYGPTETTVCATISDPLHADGPIDIGSPLPNAAAYILDSGLRPLPDGIPGELYVAGAPLARGYHNRPELTAERFLPDPFSPQPGSRMYRTGDRARRTSYGRIEYLGRIDFQVKLRGFRIEPGEIEARLEAASSVLSAYAIVREDQPGDRRLFAYVTPASSAAKPEPSHLLTALRSELPDYMLPAAIIVLDALPLTSSGKVNRAALPAPNNNRAASSSTFVAPRNEAERTITAIWREALHLESFSVHDNFFDLGGHSLLMMQVHGKLKEAFPKEISLIQMFGYPTVEKLAEFFTQTEPQRPARAFASIHERVAQKREALKRVASQEAS